MAKSGQIERPWYLFDVADKTLGRVATQIAAYLRGKNNPFFTPHVLTGPYVIVLNAGKIRVTGDKRHSKIYQHYTGYPGGLKSERFDKLFARFPTRILEKAVKGMLPKNSLGRAAYRCLKIYVGIKHPHLAQNPQKIELHS